MRSPGTGVVMAFIALFYLGPMLATLALGNDLGQITRITPLTFSALAFLAVTLLLFFLLRHPTMPRAPSLRMRPLIQFLRRIGRIYLQYRHMAAVFAFILALVVTLQGLNNYRYGTQSVLDRESPVLLLGIFVHRLVAVDMIWAMFARQARPEYGRLRHRSADILMSTAWVIGATGTADLMLGLIALIFAISPRLFSWIAFNGKRQAQWNRTVRTTATFLGASVLLLASRLVGETIKSLPQRVGAVNVNVFVATLVGTASSPTFGPGNDFGFDASLVERLGTYYYAFLLTHQQSWASLNDSNGWTVLAPLRTFGFRLDFLLGHPFGIDRPEVGSMARVNLLNLYTEIVNSRQGATPGLLAAFNYAAFFPFNVILVALYMRWVAGFIDRLVAASRRSSRLSLPGSMILLVFIIFLFQSPFDLLRVLDPTVLILCLLWVIGKSGMQDRAERHHSDLQLQPVHHSTKSGRSTT